MSYKISYGAITSMLCAYFAGACTAAEPEETAYAEPAAQHPERRRQQQLARDFESTPSVQSAPAPVPSDADEEAVFGGDPAMTAELQMAGDEAFEEFDHDFFSTVWVDDRDSASLPMLGDLWPSCWSDDDALYTSSGDGTGSEVQVGEILVHRIDGRPGDARDPLRGTTLAGGADVAPRWAIGYTMKPTGMLCANGELYLAVQDLRAFSFSDAHAATIVHSLDKGRTWSWDSRAPMFSDHVFTTIMFVDFGKDNEHAPDEFAYAYGLDDNWSASYSASPPQTKLYLGRVPVTSVQNRAKWEFFSGFDDDGAPKWSPDIAQRAPVLEDAQRRYQMPIDRGLAFQNMTTLSQGGVVYNAGLKRYIYSTWTIYTLEFYEAPQPWGPWTHFHTKDFGAFPWTEDASGGYGTPIPSKFISEDGRSMWMNSNVWQAGVIHYQYSLRRIRVDPYMPSSPSNEQSAEPLSTERRDAVPLVRSSHSGHVEFLNDGVARNQSLESWTGERNDQDYWGYTWSRALRVNKVRYTTGGDSARGGWFEQLSVQVRHGRDWVAVSGLTTTPDYRGDRGVLGNKTFTLSFDETVTDGVRIFGRPGGRDCFTSVAELGIYYE